MLARSPVTYVHPTNTPPHRPDSTHTSTSPIHFFHPSLHTHTPAENSQCLASLCAYPISNNSDVHSMDFSGGGEEICIDNVADLREVNNINHQTRQRLCSRQCTLYPQSTGTQGLHQRALYRRWYATDLPGKCLPTQRLHCIRQRIFRNRNPAQSSSYRSYRSTYKPQFSPHQRWAPTFWRMCLFRPAPKYLSW
jgi:hypothetical protein